MKPDPVRQHLDTRTEAEIRWHMSFLAGTRQRLLRRAPTPSRPSLTPEQVDIVALKADRERDTYRLALMIVEGTGRASRREREERASKCVTNWSVAFRQHKPTPGPGVYEQPEYPGGNVQR